MFATKRHNYILIADIDFDVYVSHHDCHMSNVTETLYSIAPRLEHIN